MKDCREKRGKSWCRRKWSELINQALTNKFISCHAIHTVLVSHLDFFFEKVVTCDTVRTGVQDDVNFAVEYVMCVSLAFLSHVRRCKGSASALIRAKDSRTLPRPDIHGRYSVSPSPNYRITWGNPNRQDTWNPFPRIILIFAISFFWNLPVTNCSVLESKLETQTASSSIERRKVHYALSSSAVAGNINMSSWGLRLMSSTGIR